MIATNERTVDRFLELVHDSITNGTCIPDPQTVDELRAASNEFPEYAFRWRPAADIAALYDLPSCRPIKPLDIETQLAFIEAITIDDSFRTCLRLATGNEVAV